MIRTNIFSTGAQKLLCFPNHLDQWQRGRAVTPVALEIHPSEKCNHHCPQCQSKFILSSKEVHLRSSQGAFLDLTLLDSIWNHPPQGIILSGNTGDPLMHPEIGQLLQIIKSKAIPVTLITNGQAMTPELAEVTVDTCLGVRISLDACDAESFLLTHGVNEKYWHILLENISILVKAKKNRLNSKCLIGLAFLTDDRSIRWMLDATKLAKQLGVDYIQFRPYHFNTTNPIRLLESCETLEDQNFHVLSSYQKYSHLGECLVHTHNNCQASWFYTVLDSRGDFYICCHNVGNPEARLGSLTNQSWIDFIHSTRRREIIENFSTQTCIPNCRLKTHNEFLIAYRSPENQFPTFDLDDQIRSHAAFL